MNFEQYAPLARRTLKVLPTLAQHITHLNMGVIGEYGELIDAFKKVAIYGKPVDQPNRVEEIGDIAWYAINYCEELKVDVSTLAEAFAEGHDDDDMKPSGDLFVDAGVLVMMSAASAMSCAELAEPETTATNAQDSIKGLFAILGATCRLLEVNIEEALDKNIAKLAARYGDKYSDYMALNRDLDAERAILETPPV